jgi:hypothetical protein
MGNLPPDPLPEGKGSESPFLLVIRFWFVKTAKI